MKKLLLIILLTIPFSVSAQSFYSDFALEDQAITHIKIYEPEDTVDLKSRIIDMLSLTSGVKDVQDRGNYVIATIEKMTLDYKKHGANPFWFPVIVQNGINGRIRVDIKEGKYRTAISSIEFINEMEATVYGVTNKGSDQTMERMVTNRKRDQFKGSDKWNKVMFYMNEDFTEKFTVAAPVASEDW